ncbi:hypothetical protein [Streptomyces sp. NPDC102360]|uniref:hypothetical protein n=1 Tax=Streptomyces sp. NPDC102360 TaxID=3366160 RepID=UPI00382DA8DA
MHESEDPLVQSIVLREPTDGEEYIPPGAVLLAVGYPSAIRRTGPPAPNSSRGRASPGPPR